MSYPSGREATGRTSTGRAIALAAAITAIPGCSSNSSGLQDSQGPQGPQDITIKIFSYFPYTGATSNASFVAFQDGDEPWVALAGTGGVYHGVATGARYGIAIGCTTTPIPALVQRRIAITYQTVMDATEFDAGCGGAPVGAPLATLSGSLSGIATGEQGMVTAAGQLSAEGAAAGPDGHYQLRHERGDPFDLFAGSFATGPSSIQIPSKLYRGATVDLTADQVLDINLDSDGAPPQTASLTIGGAADGDELTVTTSVVTPAITFSVARQSYSTVPTSYLAPPAPQLRTGDLVSVHATTIPSSVPASYGFRNVTGFWGAVGQQTLELPAPWTVDPPTLVATPYPRLAFTLPVTAAAPDTQRYTAEFSADVRAVPGQLDSRSWSITISQGYAAGRPSLAVTAPDLSGLSGFGAELALPSATQVFWNISLGDVRVASRLHDSDGDVVAYSGIGGSLTP